MAMQMVELHIHDRASANAVLARNDGQFLLRNLPWITNVNAPAEHRIALARIYGTTADMVAT